MAIGFFGSVVCIQCKLTTSLAALVAISIVVAKKDSHNNHDNIAKSHNDKRNKDSNNNDQGDNENGGNTNDGIVTTTIVRANRKITVMTLHAVNSTLSSFNHGSP